MNFSKRLAICGVALFLAALSVAAPVMANNPALDFSGGTPIDPIYPGDPVYPTDPITPGDPIREGWAFNTSAAILLTDLGIWDGAGGDGFVGDGLREAHVVTLWTSLGVKVAELTVPSGTAGTLFGEFRYSSLATAVLLAPRRLCHCRVV